MRWTKTALEECIMRKDTDFSNGLELLLKKYREQFRTCENLDHYSKEDFKKAEKKFLKYVLGRNPDA